MRPLFVLACVVAVSVPVPAQSQLAPRVATATVGVGNAMGWFGVQAEKYLSGDRFSVFAGLGYTPEGEPGEPSGATVAGGLRGFTGGIRHRGFLEASITQVEIELAPDGRRRYGPGLAVGYQYTANRGFTIMVSGGAGYPFGRSDYIIGSSIVPIFNIGLGYTWR